MGDLRRSKTEWLSLPERAILLFSRPVRPKCGMLFCCFFHNRIEIVSWNENNGKA